MSDDRTLAPMAHDTILPMIRTLHGLLERARAQDAAAERGEAGGSDAYYAAAMLEERIRQPITVAGRVLEPCGDREMCWYHSDISLMASVDTWRCVLTVHGSPDTAITVQTQGRGPTIAAALADAHERYQAAIADTLLRMGGLLREVVS